LQTLDFFWGGGRLGAQRVTEIRVS